MQKRIVVFVLVSLLVVALALTGCGKDDNLTTVRLSEVTHSVFYAPMYVAMNQGYFEEEGLRLEVTTGQGADKVMTALLAGEADIGFMGPEASVYVYNEGQDNYAVNFAQLTTCDGSFLVAREPDPDFTWEKVRGKSIIGGRKGGMPLMTLEYVLKKAGYYSRPRCGSYDPYSVCLDGGCLYRGEGDYVTLFEPVASALELEGAGYVVASVGADSGKIPILFSVPGKLMEENPELIKSLPMPSTGDSFGYRKKHRKKLLKLLRLLSRMRIWKSWQRSRLVTKKLMLGLLPLFLPKNPITACLM